MEKRLEALIPRYEDFAEDGRPLLGAIPPSLGSVWRAQLAGDPIAARLRESGIVPILSRIEIAVGEDSFASTRPIEVFGDGQLVRGDGPKTAGDYERVLLDIRTRVVAETGHAILPFTGPSEMREVGRMLGEHVLTRLFAEKGERRVTAPDLASLGVPVATSRPWSPAAAILEVEPDAVPLDADFVRDPSPIVFGLMHTDANQHVNSLVYPRLFEESVVRSLVARGRSARVLARRLVIGYRKPSFVGERVQLASRLFARDGSVVAIGVFLGEGEDDVRRGRCFVRLELLASP